MSNQISKISMHDKSSLVATYASLFENLKQSGIGGMDKNGSIANNFGNLGSNILKTESFNWYGEVGEGFEKFGDGTTGSALPISIIQSFKSAILKTNNDIEANSNGMDLIRQENYSGKIPALGVESGPAGLTHAQYQAGLLASLFGQNMEQWYSGSKNLVNGGKNMSNYESGQIMTIPDVKQEAWSGQTNYDAVYYAIAINIMSARSDDLVEIIYPTVMINPKETGLKVEVTYTSFMTPYIRSLAGDPRKPEYLPLLKNAYNADILGQERTLVVPNVTLQDSKNNKAEDKLLKDLAEINKAPGVPVKTAPYKIDERIDILGLGQNELTLANGEMNWTDSLTGSINLTKAYIQIGDNSSNAKIFPINTSYLTGSTFNTLNQDNYKNLAVNLDRHKYIFTVGKTKPCKTMNSFENDFPTFESGQAFDTSAKNGYSYYFEYSLGGNINIETAECSVSQKGQIRLIKITDENGMEVDMSSGAGQTAAQHVQTAITNGYIKIVGYDLRAYRLNDNFRTSGQQIRVDAFSTYLDVGWKSGFGASGPIQNYAGEFNDITFIKNIGEYNYLICSNDGINTLFETKDFLSTITSLPEGTDDVKTKILGQLVCNPYYEEKSIDVGNIIESLESTTKMENLRAAFINALIPIANNMFIKSNYNVVLRLDSMHADKKANIVIATHERVAQVLCYGQASNVFPLTDKINLIVVSTPNLRLENKMFLVFSVTTQIGEVKEPNLLHHGIRAASPTITVELNPRSTGGIMQKEILSIPRWQFHTLNPIMAYIEIANDLDSNLAKKNVYMTKQSV